MRRIPLNTLLGAVHAFNLEAHTRIKQNIPLATYLEAENYALAHPDEFTVLFQCCSALQVAPDELTQENVRDWYERITPRIQ